MSLSLSLTCIHTHTLPPDACHYMYVCIQICILAPFRICEVVGCLVPPPRCATSASPRGHNTGLLNTYKRAYVHKCTTSIRTNGMCTYTSTYTYPRIHLLHVRLYHICMHIDRVVDLVVGAPTVQCIGPTLSRATRYRLPCFHICIYIYIHLYRCTHMYIYIYINYVYVYM